MPTTNTTKPNALNLNALVGSRICHDLINPLGAIGNGIELLELTGSSTGPEMDLVVDSVAGATARLKYLRLAFGEASADQICARAEVLSTLEDVAVGGRLSYSWMVLEDARRLDVRAALLAAMCVETALPLGGDIKIDKDDTTWTVIAQHERLNLDPALWVPLSKNAVPDTLSGAQVHFGLLPDMTAEAGRELSLSHGADWVKIAF
ncbi:histidine phosphotransferase family protein [Octadecabacter sp. 1_MG-2023]|uniref:histidine phosphotransferase family protein n=1 Tax=unclassified Octadecabacter TaxID=196158 RepID=UPI002090D884|nr:MULTISPECIES: histidine phosphotransferase family protein [unclassified Octadecabacter]MDO6733192.1 histidine phosphotransferase family protein [Octadecabacter sp. 1_MG-2023]